jgi:hypoxanthine phosphoribosyltransferase
MTRYFSWREFDQSVDYIANQCKEMKLTGIYGVPRGGLCLAVALSHKLNLKLIEKPLKNSLIVDDVYETGITLSNFKNIEGVNFFVLVSKKKPIWWNSVDLSYKEEWIVFPWENINNKLNEEKEYKNKRGLK